MRQHSSKQNAATRCCRIHHNESKTLAHIDFAPLASSVESSEIRTAFTARPSNIFHGGINLSFASKSEAATSSYYGASITSIDWRIELIVTASVGLVWSGQHLAHNAQRQNAPAYSTHYFAITIEENFFPSISKHASAVTAPPPS